MEVLSVEMLLVDALSVEVLLVEVHPREPISKFQLETFKLISSFNQRLGRFCGARKCLHCAVMAELDSV